MDCYIHIRNNTLTKGGDKVVTEVRSSLFIQLFIYFISLNLFCKRQERNITHTHTHTYTQEINNIKAQCILSTENTSLNPMSI